MRNGISHERKRKRFDLFFPVACGKFLPERGLWLVVEMLIELREAANTVERGGEEDGVGLEEFVAKNFAFVDENAVLASPVENLSAGDAW